MRVLFAGTPALAVPSLERVSAVNRPCAVLTSADQPAGRGKRLESSPVKEGALQLGLALIEADRITDETETSVRELAPDLLVVVAFGRIFKKSFLGLFPQGGINLHPSLLPRFRGPSPISSVILAGERETGVTVQKIAPRFDSGDILAQEKVPLRGDETTGSLSDSLGRLGAEVLAGVLDRLAHGGVPAMPQREEEATYCHMVKKEDGLIDWRQGAALIERKVRAYDPWPHAYTHWRGLSLLVLKSRLPTGTLREAVPAAGAVPGTILGAEPGEGLLVMTGDGLLVVERLQLQARKAMDWRSFLNGHPDVIGTQLGG